MYLLIKYIKSVLWRVAKRLSYMEDARCLKVNTKKLLTVYTVFFLLQIVDKMSQTQLVRILFIYKV